MKKIPLFPLFWTLMGLMLPARLHAQAPDAKMDAFIENLMSRMTLEEKIGQMNYLDLSDPMTQKVAAEIQRGLVGGVHVYTLSGAQKLQSLSLHESRLGIPLLLEDNVIHGYKTIFPIPLALSCTWNPKVIEQSARIAADEATANGVDWTMAPGVDISRDPRWGRVAEMGGEDPYLGALIAQAMVRGYQGDDLSQSNAMMACVKHFGLYGAVEAGREYNAVDMSTYRMYNYYFPPYRAAVEAGAGSVMPSFNDINGVPSTANHWLLTDVLRKQWGFQGFVVSDFDAIPELNNWGLGDSLTDAELALNAGVDMDCAGDTYLKCLRELVNEGKIPESLIDQACRRILQAKYKLGLFTNPYHGLSAERARKEILSPENLKFAREVAAQSCVLLKDDEYILPLRKSGTIALIGPLADDQQNLLGCWAYTGDWHLAVSVAAGISNVVGSAVNVLYAKGANLIDNSQLLATFRGFGMSAFRWTAVRRKRCWRKRWQ